MGDGSQAIVQVSVSKAVVEGAEALGLYVSRIAEIAIRRSTRAARQAAMTQEERQKIQAEIKEEIAWHKEHVDKHGLFSDRWCRF